MSMTENPKLKWKIERDPFYRDLYVSYGYDFIEYAGFMYDSNDRDVDLGLTVLDFPCTPLGCLEDISDVDVNPCVLLTTGSFCPIHDGHVEMVLKAKEACEKGGYKVMGAYFAPDHDEYVGSKNKERSIPIHRRIDIINDRIKDYHWMHVDPWAGLFGEVALNFTDIYERLRLYIQSHIGRDISVFFVCGSDNLRLAFTFRDRGNCVVVTRPGAEGIRASINLLAGAVAEKRMFFVDNDNDSSSTRIRNNGYKQKEKVDKLFVRHDDVNTEDDRELAVIGLLKDRFEHVVVNNLSEQMDAFNRLKAPVISVDSLIKGDYNLPISRMYDMFGLRMLRFCTRPGCDGELDFSWRDDHESYFIFDDDIHTGRTMEYAKMFLGWNRIRSCGVITLTKSERDEEVLDARDFLYGGTNNGLVIQDPVTKDGRRYPYVYPFVDPYVRASIEDPMDFSIAVWKLNMGHFLSRMDYDKYYDCKFYHDLLKNLKR